MAFTENSLLQRAKDLKNDEYYTGYDDVHRELSYYTESFSGKSVYCNCDDYRKSNIYKYLRDHYEQLGLTGLCATCYPDGLKCVYDGTSEHVTRLDGDGSFDSDECIELVKQYDMVCTNPPFSKKQSFLKIIHDYAKYYMIVLPLTVTHSYGMMNLVMHRGCRCGVTSLCDFERADGSFTKVRCYWYTNLKNHVVKPNRFTKNFAETHPCRVIGYTGIPMYNTIKDVPYDYDGPMMAPINTFCQINMDEYEVLGVTDSEYGAKYCNLEEYKEFPDVRLSKYGTHVLNDDGTIKHGFTRLIFKKRTKND